MINHYQILGVSESASLAEIKAAFRQLAMVYHPDKNPADKDRFNLILKAYETLSDPRLKATYDYKLNYFQHQGQSSKASSSAVKRKQWRFDEQELKRRNYYNEHIKKYEKVTESYGVNPAPKSNYNEFKYILYATPLAVLLFVGIMWLASSNTGKFGLSAWLGKRASSSSTFAREA